MVQKRSPLPAATSLIVYMHPGNRPPQQQHKATTCLRSIHATSSSGGLLTREVVLYNHSGNNTLNTTWATPKVLHGVPAGQSRPRLRAQAICMRALHG